MHKDTHRIRLLRKTSYHLIGGNMRTSELSRALIPMGSPPLVAISISFRPII